jgi:hypothetical protein
MHALLVVNLYISAKICAVNQKSIYTALILLSVQHVSRLRCLLTYNSTKSECVN